MMSKIIRRQTRCVQVGNLVIGNGSPITIQSMTNTKTEDAEKTLDQVKRLYTAGADFVRITVPNIESVKAFQSIHDEVQRPLIADIHFDYRLALLAFEAGAAKVRINPGNIGSWAKVKEIIAEAKHLGRAIRIGVNGGSLDKKILSKYGSPNAEALCESALEYERQFLNEGFDNFVVSIKSSNVLTNIRANRMFASQSNTPLHLGVTEAGTPKVGQIKAAIGIGSLLADGIGDTFRVSLTADPILEVFFAQDLLRVLGERKEGIEIISCPTCGRTNGDLIRIVNEVEERTSDIKTPLKVAIMGCVVNGPGEAREADLGIALGLNKAVLFSKGEIESTISAEKCVAELVDRIRKAVK